MGSGGVPQTPASELQRLRRRKPLGRGQPLSEGISPVQGADRLGPTAVICSAARMDHLRTGGPLLNMKLSTVCLVIDSIPVVKPICSIRWRLNLRYHHSGAQGVNGAGR